MHRRVYNKNKNKYNEYKYGLLERLKRYDKSFLCLYWWFYNRKSQSREYNGLLGIIVAPIGFIGGFIKGLVDQVDVAKDVLVVWCSPKKGKTVIVGWYRNATVYRQYFDLPVTIATGIARSFFCKAKADDCFLLPECERDSQTCRYQSVVDAPVCTWHQDGRWENL